MTKATPGARVPDHEELYSRPCDDPLIHSDMVSPAVEGYFRIPAIWVGQEPKSDETLRLRDSVHHEIVVRRSLDCGVAVVVQRDGTFLFDFSSWHLAPSVRIPGFTTKEEINFSIPPDTAKAQEKAAQNAVIRAQAMNVHQACLTTAEREVQNRAAAMGLPLSASETFKQLTLEEAYKYRDDVEDTRALSRNVINNWYGIDRDHALPRRTMEINVIERSLSLLDTILAKEDGALIQLVEAMYISACRIREKRYGEALTLSWGACEQLVSLMWRTNIQNIRKNDSARINSDRMKKLMGRDYTASAMVEYLELMEAIDRDLYKLLDVARKARNAWMHDLEAPDESVAHKSLQAASIMLANVHDIHLQLQTAGRGGVPMWPAWTWGAARSSKAPE